MPLHRPGTPSPLTPDSPNTPSPKVTDADFVPRLLANTNQSNASTKRQICWLKVRHQECLDWLSPGAIGSPAAVVVHSNAVALEAEIARLKLRLEDEVEQVVPLDDPSSCHRTAASDFDDVTPITPSPRLLLKGRVNQCQRRVNAASAKLSFWLILEDLESQGLALDLIREALDVLLSGRQ